MDFLYRIHVVHSKLHPHTLFMECMKVMNVSNGMLMTWLDALESVEVELDALAHVFINLLKQTEKTDLVKCGSLPQYLIVPFLVFYKQRTAGSLPLHLQTYCISMVVQHMRIFSRLHSYVLQVILIERWHKCLLLG